MSVRDAALLFRAAGIIEHEETSDAWLHIASAMHEHAADGHGKDGWCKPEWCGLLLTAKGYLLGRGDEWMGALAHAWDLGFRQALVANGHVPETSDPDRFGPPTTGPHRNPYRDIPHADALRTSARAVCNCIVVRDLARDRHVWMNGSFGDCGHPPTGTPVTEKTRPIPPEEGRRT